MIELELGLLRLRGGRAPPLFPLRSNDHGEAESNHARRRRPDFKMLGRRA